MIDFRRWFLLFIVGLASAAQAQNINISLLAQHEPPNSNISFGDVWAEGDIACLGIWLGYSTSYGVGIYSISNPAAPTLLSIYSSPTSSHNQFELGALRNRIGYFGSWSGGGVHIVSLTNPAAPVFLSKIGSAQNGFDKVHTLFLERDFLYEAAHVSGTNQVKVIDISNPFAPTFVRDIVCTNAYKIHQITAVKKGASTILYTSDFGGGPSSAPGQTDIWDVTHVGTQPATWLGKIISGSSSHSSWPTPDGNTLIVCRETMGGDVRLYDISNPANPVLQCAITPSSMGLPAAIPHNPVVVSNLLFLSWYQNGVQIFDITDRTKPVRIGSYDTYPSSSTSSFVGNWGVFPDFGLSKLLLSDIQSGLYILDASAVLTATNNYPPLIVNLPSSITATQGMTATISATVTGSSLAYQWKFNGTNISGATGSSLVLSNVQLEAAGNYSVQVGNAAATLTSSAVSLSVLIPDAPTQVVFSENFDSAASSNNWNVFDGAANGTSDYTAEWDFNYNTYFSEFNESNIPPAPNSTNGTTRGLRLTVNNNDAVQSTAGVSLYPKNQTFSGAYKLKFDMWMNYPGVAGGSGAAGSTENAIFGLNHSGTRVNWHSANPSDGTWFTVMGEGGDSNNRDYRAYEGNLSGQAPLLSFTQTGFGVSGAVSANNTDLSFRNIFPSTTSETPGAPGKQWVEVEISQDANKILKWKMNGNLIAQRSNTSPFTNGTIMIGYMDIFGSIANPAEDAFVLFDNLRVEVPISAVSPQISSHPQNAAVYPGQDAIFSVAATGTETLNFQWRFNNENILGATSSSLTVSNVQPELVGKYSVVVFNNYGSAVSSNALLTLIDSPYLNTVKATPGARSALISWKSTIPSDSMVQFSVANAVIESPSAMSAMGASFGSSSYIDRNIITNHSILLTGLTPGTLYSFQVISTAETNSYVSGVYQFTTAGAVIVDNPEAVFTGQWTDATFSTDRFGTNYQFASSVTAPATATATFRPNLPTAGKYDLHVFYPQGGNRANNAPYTISSSAGELTVPVNQQSGGGAWQSIASARAFASGTSGFVRVANNANPSVVIADAVRFTYVESQETSLGEVPAWWEEFYFETNIDPSIDHDNDGYSTADEYVLGTSPTDAESHLKVDLQASGSSANVTFWPYVGNRDYQLLFKTNITDANWEILSPGSITPTPYGHGIFSVSPANVSHGFYRLVVQLVPEGSFSGKMKVAAESAFVGFAEAACGVNRVYVIPAVKK